MTNRFWSILRLTVTRWTRNDGNLLAASMAYYAAFSFFPLLLVLISAVGFALQFSEKAQSAQQYLLQILSEQAPRALADDVDRIVTGILSNVQSRAAYGGPVGLVTLLLGAIGIFSQLEEAFHRLWQDTSPATHGILSAIENALWNRLKAFLTLVALGLMVFVAFFAEILLTGLRTWAQDLPDGLWQAAQPFYSVAVNTFVLAIVYRVIPRASVQWRHAAVGGVLVAIAWQFGSQIVARFIVGGHYSAYGVVGSFIAMMLWVYCASILLLLGAQMVQVLGNPEETADGQYRQKTGHAKKKRSGKRR